MTIVPFTPSPNASPPFTAVVMLDNVTYGLATMWNFYRGDWYMSLTDQAGNVIINQPLIGSPDNYDIFLAPGIFMTSKILFRVSTQNFEVSP